MITLEVSGIKYQGWTDITITRNIETISGSFAFGATSSGLNVFPIKAAEPCKVWVGTTMVINGYVDAVNVSYDATSHAIHITGRDRTADFVDSTISSDSIKEFEGMELIPIIETVLENHNASYIKVINQAGDIEPEHPDKAPSSNAISETIFAFWETYARKRQVLLTTDGLGNIVLARAATDTSTTILENIINGTANNIKSATVNYDYTKRFNKYTLQSGQNPTNHDVNYSGTSEASTEDAVGTDYSGVLSSVAEQTGEFSDPEIRNTRTTEIIAKTTDNTVNLDDLAEWTANLARARSREYSAVVVGYFQDAAQTMVWKPNILVKVVDNFAKIDATLLIKSVEYKLSLDNGSTTTICLVDSDSYTLQLQIESETEKKKKRSNTLGNDIVYDPGVTTP